MVRIRVLVAEDSLTVRQRLVEILSGSPDLEVVGAAEDGKRAIELCQRFRPDVISMDMMMPVMTGLSATEYIMAHCPTPILVVSASVNRAELFRTYEALAAGAVDVLEKPLGTEPAGEWERKYVAAVKLVSRIRVITHPRGRLGALGRQAEPAPVRPVEHPLEGRSDAGGRQRGCELVAIGASTGGPGAIVDILRGLPANFRLPIALVLHINEPFGTAFADWLDGQTARRVACPADGDPVGAAAGRVVMAPVGRHLVVRDGRFRLSLEAERHSCRPSVDVLFEAVAQDYGPAAAGCLLTGMGRDGAAGLLSIRRAGGMTIAQDESTSVIYGMPREAVLLGAAARVLRLEEIAPALAMLDADARAQP
jgi:two-component system, chemotaxis family, protein-glutamate methylesterase/glutaminase